MSKETFTFTSSTLRSLRLQQEMLEWEDRRRAASRQSVSRRYQPSLGSLSALPKPARRPQYCRDPAVHNALYTGDLPRVRSIFKDESTANLIVETLSEELVWSAEMGKKGLSIVERRSLGLVTGVLDFDSFLWGWKTFSRLGFWQDDKLEHRNFGPAGERFSIGLFLGFLFSLEGCGETI